ncbi:hypothetical protein PIB30_057374 [Stylosanthes scabra]|uniref:Uncharacterized protein n=1 Tax=Stylosanthes scabra TaxID=79078 RepID=A0ABU6QJ39_9FABA|nr:hypothetical protein [Stylosanthes scabra]
MQAIKEKIQDIKESRKAKAELKAEEKAEKELAKARMDIAHEARLAREAEAEMDRDAPPPLMDSGITPTTAATMGSEAEISNTRSVPLSETRNQGYFTAETGTAPPSAAAMDVRSASDRHL